MIHVYAVLAEAPPLGDLHGLDGAPVELRTAAGLTLAASEHGTAPQLDEAAVLRHAQVVDELVRAGATVLPARLGLGFDDEVALRRALRERAAELRAGLERVSGCVELGLRVLAPEPNEPTAGHAGSGGEYLRARLRETTERERLATELHEGLAAQARDSTRRAPPSGTLLLSAAYLVPSDEVESFTREVRRLEWSHPELGLVCTGPWPPYSFAPAAEAAS